MNITFISSANYAELSITYTVISNPLDAEQPLMVAVCSQGVVAIRPLVGNSGDIIESHWMRDDAPSAAIDEVKAFLSGALIEWSCGVVMSGSPFRQKVWQEIANIPFGETITYSELAKRSGNAKAFRAAASGCATNPVPLIVPCHRVLGKRGGLGGFAWGVPYKRALLALEKSPSLECAA